MSSIPKALRSTPAAISLGLAAALLGGLPAADPARAGENAWIAAAIGRAAPAAASPADRRALPPKQARPPAPVNPFLAALNLLPTPTFAPFGVKQGTCVDSDIVHVEGYASAGAIKPADLSRWQKATVRLRVMGAPHAKARFQTMPAARRADPESFSIGGFAPIAGMNEGVCTGTLIQGNVLLTAGHCVSIDYWQGERNVEFPTYTVRGEKVPLTASEFALLLLGDLDYQLDLSTVASLGELALPQTRALLSFKVRQLVASENTTNGLDYAIMRVDANASQVEGYALPSSRLSYMTPQPARPVAVVQHPDGGPKKVSVGETASHRAGAARLAHTASTSGGSSGAGVLDSRGRVVAIHIEGGCDSPQFGNRNSALPLSRIRSRIRAALGQD
jgi:hypothetical protein